MTAQVAAELLIEAVCRAIHIPHLGAPPGANVLDGEARHAALPLDFFGCLRVSEGAEMNEPPHIPVVVTEAGLRHPWPEVQDVLGGESWLVVVIGAIVRPIEVVIGI